MRMACVCFSLPISDWRARSQGSASFLTGPVALVMSVCERTMAEIQLFFWLKLALWFAANTFFSIYAKRACALGAEPFELTTQLVSLGAAVAACSILGGAVCVPRCRRAWTHGVLPSAALFLGGTTFTNVSLSHISVGFTHVIKACEPMFTAGLLYCLKSTLPDKLGLLLMASIAIGVVIASVSDFPFSALGVAACLASNFCLQLRNILNHDLMATRFEFTTADDPRQLNALELLLLTFLAALPMQLALHAAAALAAPVSSPATLLWSPSAESILSACCFFVYQSFSIMVLSQVGPLTHAGSLLP